MTNLLRLRALAALAAIAIADAASAQDFTSFAPDEDLVLGQAFTGRSEILDEDRRLFVSTPDGYAGESALPVLYLLDARQHFAAVSTMVHYLGEQGELPEMIVVGVYNGSDRGRDMTPDKRPEVSNSGGGDDFLRYLKEEVRPFVEANYQTNGYDILAGKSFGGLFALHVLLTSEDAFDAYLIASPSLWWGDGAMVERSAAVVSELESARYAFFSLADESDQMRAPFSAVTSIFKVDAPDTLQVEVRHYPDETHSSTNLIAIYDGLRTLFDDWLISERRMEDGLAGVEAHYAWIRQRTGADLEPSALILNEVGQHLLSSDEVDMAMAVLRRNAETHPSTPYVHDSLADGLLKTGDEAGARAAVEAAVAASKARGDGRAWLYERRLEQMSGAD